MTRTILSIGALLLLLSVALGAWRVESARADTPGCVTYREFQNTYRGMSKWRVHSIFDTRGTRLSAYYDQYGRFHELRMYNKCRTSADLVMMEYLRNRVVRRMW
jgi:hypothetical protein